MIWIFYNNSTVYVTLEPEEMPSPSIPKCSFDELMEDENEIDGGLDLPDISEENEF